MIKIGILGGGQLARMSSYQATRMGFEVIILEKKANSPAGQVSQKEFTGWVDNPEVLEKFVKSCDVITLENEFIDYKYLEKIEEMGVPVYPSSRTISLIQDKLVQKNTFANSNLPVPKFIEVSEGVTFDNIQAELGSRFVLKSRTMGYDGYGNALVTDELSFQAGLEKLSGRGSALMAEEFVPFLKELAVMVVRTEQEIKCYPVIETIQKDHICHTVIAPAKVNESVSKNVMDIAVHAVESVEGIGIFGVELFLLESGEVLINEMAPRPHNSGHYTIEACITSQFENHIRAVCNLPLGSVDMVKPVAVMVNLLGGRTGDGVPSNYNSALNDPDVKLHIYGKSDSRPGRKMGHITMLGDNSEKIFERLTDIENIIDI
ncbi:MAG: N5-carboxyaminoimidazole ribonucleotide synthase [Melioribacteraceae bacterium]|nr:MAG: N5-carboxyaminoimidazole ribonucleotide synthase [Melioribacteraceae bacterium]